MNTDESVRRLHKGPERPLNSIEDRLAVLAALASVSLVIPFAEDTPLELIGAVRPDVLVKGGDWIMDRLPESGAGQELGRDDPCHPVPGRAFDHGAGRKDQIVLNGPSARIPFRINLIADMESTRPHDRELDARGLNCPLPILRTKKALNEMQTGNVLKVLATDPASVKDFQAFSQANGECADRALGSRRSFPLLPAAEVMSYPPVSARGSSLTRHRRSRSSADHPWATESLPC